MAAPLWKAVLAEILGTFFLCLVGCGSIIHYNWEGLELVSIAFCFGMIIMIAVIVFGPFSGSFNPALSLALLVVKKMEVRACLAYIAAQCFGGVLAIAMLKGLSSGLPDTETWGYAQVNPRITPVQGFFIEFLLTFALVLLIFGVTDPNKSRADTAGAPLVIGLGVTALVNWGGPITGCTMNPARALGPCVIIWKFENHWVYWFGPCLGAIAAALLYEGVFAAPPPPPPVEVCLLKKVADDADSLLLSLFNIAGDQEAELEKQTQQNNGPLRMNVHTKESVEGVARFAETVSG